ncbi:MAG: hypothetical protein U0234_16930 [Sandaracinus sp.]
MPASRTLGLSCSALLLALSIVVPTAHAQAQSPPVEHAQDGGPPPAYRATIDAALDEFEAHRWAEARALFERAHEMFPNARTLRGIGMAAYELRDYVAARSALDRSLTETRRALTDEQRAQVTELLERARVFVGDFTFGPAPAGSTIAVDGVPTTPDVGADGVSSVSLAVGAHEVVLHAPDGRVARAQITVHGGEHGALTLAIAEEPAPALADPEASAAAPARTEPAPPAPAAADVTGGWVLVGVGGAIAIAGVVMLAVGLDDAAVVSRAPAGTEWADLAARYDRAVPLEITGAVALGLGVAAAAAGIAWITMQPSADTQLVLGPGSVTVRGSF